MSEGTSDASSFRDPSGFVFLHEGQPYRQVNAAYRDDYEHLMSSGLYEALTTERLLVRHEEVDASQFEADSRTTRDVFRILRPERVAFISYPYEWCFSQLKNAALTTLRIQSIALDHGMSLRDASAYNIQFHEGRPTLIDTLSFERRVEAKPWVAYRQFCQHFLAPLALMTLVDVRLGQLSRVHLDGVPLDLASNLLPARSRLHPSLAIHLHMHARTMTRSGARATKVKGNVSDRGLRGLIDSLESGIKKLEWEPEPTQWATYYSDAPSYSERAAKDKERVVAAYLQRLRPATVWDLGANTGFFSRLAVEAGAFTVSFDADPSAVEESYRSHRDEARLLPLVQDLSNPSPAIGWNNEERRSIAARGPAEALLALALVHHIAIGNNVPLERIAGTLVSWGSSLIIEFVPRSDPQVEAMLANRVDIFDTYNEDGFTSAFGAVFEIEASHRIEDSERTLYLMRARQRSSR